MAVILSNSIKSLSIMESTNQGRLLNSVHFELVERAATNRISASDQRVFDEIYHQVNAGHYGKMSA